MAENLIGTRESTVSPGTTEYYNTSTGVGFENPQQLSNFYNTLYGGNTTAENVFQAIPVSSLQSEQALTVPTATPQADALAPTAASAQQTSKSLDQYIKELTPPETETSKQYDALSAQISELLPTLGGRGEAQLQAEQQAGLPQLKTQLAQINSQLLQKVAEATKLDASYEQLIANLESPTNAQQQGIPMSAIIGQQAQARKLQLAERNSKAADIGLLQAYALGLQGQVQASQQAVDRAIDLKYQDRESTLNLKMQQLSILEGKLNKEEQIIKQALERKYNEEQEKLAEEKAKAKDNINLAFSANVQTQFVNKNGEFFRVSDGKSYSSPEEFFKDAGIKNFEEAYSKGLVTDVNAGRLADLEFAQQARTHYWDAGINLNDSQETIAQKIQNSGIFKKENYIAPVGGGKSTGLAGTYIIDAATDAGVKAIIASRPGDGGYGDAYNAVKARYGEGVAKAYDKVYQAVFNSGESVDAAFNTAKLGGLGGDTGTANSAALDIILGSANFTKEQKASITNAIQNGSDPFSVIKNQAKNIMGQTNATKLDNYETAKEQLVAVQDALTRYYQAGGKTNIFSGSYEKAINRLGEVKDPNLVSIATEIAASLQIYRNAVSGTAYSVQEGKDIASIFPGINKSQGLNEAILNGRMQAFDTTIDSTYRNVLGSTYDQLKSGTSSSYSSLSDGQAYQEYLRMIGAIK